MYLAHAAHERALYSEFGPDSGLELELAPEMANLLSNAECGPSNALSSFSKHSQQDRTLQQDRWQPGIDIQVLI